MRSSPRRITATAARPLRKMNNALTGIAAASVRSATKVPLRLELSEEVIHRLLGHHRPLGEDARLCTFGARILEDVQMGSVQVVEPRRSELFQDRRSRLGTASVSTRRSLIV